MGDGRDNEGAKGLKVTPTRERVPYDEIEHVAHARRNMKRKKEYEHLAEKGDLSGLIAEEAFAWAFGYGFKHLELLPEGDGKVDFHTPDNHTIDVKSCTKKPYCLAVPVKTFGYVDIYVLGWVKGYRRVQFIGWIYAKDMLDGALIGTLKGEGKREENYMVDVEKLRDMNELRALHYGG